MTVYYPNPHELEFFDSFGNHPSAYNYIVRDAVVHYNPYTIQSLDSVACGHYCIYFLYERSHNKSLISIVKYLTTLKRKSDQYVTSFTQVIFIYFKEIRNA